MHRSLTVEGGTDEGVGRAWLDIGVALDSLTLSRSLSLSLSTRGAAEGRSGGY